MTDCLAYQLEIDLREKGNRLADMALESGQFNVVFGNLRVGDYVVQRSVVVERKARADFVASLLDGRLFRQAAAMARSPLRSVILVEGPDPGPLPGVHPHSLLGAYISLAVAWRLPVLFSREPSESLVILRLIAEQAFTLESLEVQRYGYKPKRLARRKHYVLQGLPGIGPKLSTELLAYFGSVEKVMTADLDRLMNVRGCGLKRARAIREVLS